MFTLDEYRQRYKAWPRGHWSQAVGSFAAVMDQAWEFRPDHTGSMRDTGPFGSLRGETCFEWKEIADYCIACKITKQTHEDLEESDQGPSEPEAWQKIRYDFIITAADGGERVGVVQVSEDGTLFKGFRLSHES